MVILGIIILVLLAIIHQLYSRNKELQKVISENTGEGVTVGKEQETKKINTESALVEPVVQLSEGKLALTKGSCQWGVILFSEMSSSSFFL